MGTPTTKQAQFNEIMKCGREPVYFMNEYCKITHPTRGLIPFKTYNFQDDCVKDFVKHRFNVILKSRQLGLSTVTAAYAVWMAMFHKEKNILVIATKLKTAINFIKKVKTILNSLPNWLRITSHEDTRQEVRFKNGSYIQAIPTSEDAGRSEALSLLIVDEAAFIRNFEEIWTGLYPTLSEGGSAIILSTPNGVGGQYYNLYVGGEAKTNDFNPIKLMWYVHPEHDEAWFAKESRQFSKRKIAQEMLCVGGNTRIITKDGFKLASEICVGDEVLTHRGRFRRVLRAIPRDVRSDENLYRVSTPGARKSEIVLTGNHPIMVSRFWLNGKSELDYVRDNYATCEREFIQVDELAARRKNTDRVVNYLFPVLDINNVTNELKTIDIATLVETNEVDDETCRYRKQWGSTKRFVNVDYDLGRFVGLYVAEGYSHADKPENGFGLGFHANEFDTLGRFCVDYASKFDVRTNLQRDIVANSCRFWTTNQFFMRLVRLFVSGNRAWEKQLDMNAVLSTNVDFIKGLLIGYFEGDGMHNPTNKLNVVTTSEKLAYQVKMLLSMFKHFPRMGRAKDRTERHHEGFQLEFDGVDGMKLDELLKTDKCTLEKKQSRTRLVGEEFFIGNASYRLMSDAEKLMTAVYDFEVEDDHTFVADNIIAHNCEFIGSGDTYINADDIAWLDTIKRDPIGFGDKLFGDANGGQAQLRIERDVWVWATPKVGTKYIISADVARGDAKDYSTFHIFDCSTGDIVAEFMGKIPPDKFGVLLDKYGKLYNKAFVCPENNTFGFTTCSKLKELKYPKLVYQNVKLTQLDAYVPDEDDQVGFSTQTKSREQALGKLEELIRNKTLKSFSARLINELRTFIWSGTKAMAMKDQHDDLVMSLAIGAWLFDGIFGKATGDTSNALAMLKGISRSRTQLDTVPGSGKEVRAFMKPGMLAYNVYKPQTHQNNEAAMDDFKWLMK